MNTPTLNLRDYIIKHVEDGDTFVFGDLQIDYFERLKPFLDKVYKYSKNGDTHYIEKEKYYELTK